MKFLTPLFLLGAVTGCASSDAARPAPAPGASSEGREYVDRLRVDQVDRPTPMGGQAFGTWHEISPAPYAALGWSCWYAGCARPWLACADHRPMFWSRCGYPRPICY